MSDDPSRAFDPTAVGRVVRDLRDRILAGRYPKGSSLPTQRELAAAFAVSRDTVQRALKELAQEGWIQSRQGSGSKVIKAPPDLDVSRGARIQTKDLSWFVGRVFDQDVVRLDVYCLTSESLDTHLRYWAERVQRQRARKPTKFRLRMMLPDATLKLPFPRTLKDEGDGRVLERLHRISERSLASVTDTLQNLRVNGPLDELTIEVRDVPLAPTHKLYLLNEAETFSSLYKLEERLIPLTAEGVKALDVLSVGASGTWMRRDEEDPDDPHSTWVTQHQDWFNSFWDLLAVPRPHQQ